MLDDHTACLDQRGCKSLRSSGCCLDYEQRPVACNLFPYVLVDGRLYLYLICPASAFTPQEMLKSLGREVWDWLGTLPSQDLERISIHLDADILAERYQDLGLSPVVCR